MQDDRAAVGLQKLDANGDGRLTSDEYLGERPGPAGSIPGSGAGGSPRGQRPPAPLELALDADQDGTISAAEMTSAAAAVEGLDRDGDGLVSREESQPPRPEDRRERGGETGSGREGPWPLRRGGSDAGERARGPGSGGGSGFTMEQTLSDEAQWTTIAFDGVGFLTGSLGADSWFPPGKVADFWGFQYLRDNDPSRQGHNTDFLTRAANNMLAILTPVQKARLADLATRQVDLIKAYGYKRFLLMKAFRRLLEGQTPPGAPELSESAVKAFSAELYRLDGEITNQRAQVMGEILLGLSPEQRSAVDALVGKGMSSWPDLDDQVDKRRFSHDVHVAIMTYAGDLFSWYAGSVDADVYFCPERQGTYFGAFFLKGGAAMGKRNVNLNENLTADLGREFVAALNPTQARLITGLVDVQRPDLLGIVECRRAIATHLRGCIAGKPLDTAAVNKLMERYGEHDGAIVHHFASTFVQVARSLTPEQRAVIQGLRTRLNLPEPGGAFLYSSPIPMPPIPSTDFLFGAGTVSATSGQTTATNTCGP